MIRINTKIECFCPVKHHSSKKFRRQFLELTAKNRFFFNLNRKSQTVPLWDRPIAEKSPENNIIKQKPKVIPFVGRQEQHLACNPQKNSSYEMPKGFFEKKKREDVFGERKRNSNDGTSASTHGRCYLLCGFGDLELSGPAFFAAAASSLFCFLCSSLTSAASSAAWYLASSCWVHSTIVPATCSR